MLLGEIFNPFIEKRPICVVARGVLERLLDPAKLNEIFEKTAQSGYTRKVAFRRWWIL